MAEAAKALYQWYVVTGPISPGLQNLTATRFMNFWATVMLQNQDVDLILKARQGLDETPADLAQPTGSEDYYSQPVDTYFFERYKAKYHLPGLTQRVSMPVRQVRASPQRRAPSHRRHDTGQGLRPALPIGPRGPGGGQDGQAAAGKEARDEAGRFVSDSEMYVLATEALQHKVLAALCKGRMLESGDRSLAPQFSQQLDESVAAYERLAALTDRTYLFSNDLAGRHWKTEGLSEFRKDRIKQRAWLEGQLKSGAK